MSDGDHTSGGGPKAPDAPRKKAVPPPKPSPPAKPTKPAKPPLPAAGKPAAGKAAAPLKLPQRPAGAPAAREQETLMQAGDFSEQSPVSEIVPLVSLPPEGDPGDKYIGHTIDGRYQVLEVLGEGGMGVVYRCRRRVFDTVVAVKILRSDFAKNGEATERFVTEAKAASAIGHAHIVDVLDFGELPDGSVYFAMEYLDGHTLGELIESNELMGTLRPVHIGRQIAEGLAAAHRAGIVHRDLKPENVFIVERDGADFVKILDFGIAKVVGAANKITRAGAVFGTPHYMSPEQCRGTAVEHRSDIYSLGVILYEMVTGRPPFDAENPLGILSQHLHEAPLAPGELDGVPPLPPGLEPLILRCLAKEPADRYDSMADVAAALTAVGRGEPLEDVPITVSLDSSVPPPPPPSSPEPERSSLPSYAPFPLSRRSLVDGIPAAAPPAAPVPSSKPREHVPPTLMAVVDDADVAAFRKAQRGKRWGAVLGVLLLLAGAGWATHGVWLPNPALLPEAFQAARPFMAGDHVEVDAQRGQTPAGQSVALVLSPIDATVYRGKEKLGTMPLSVQVSPGEPLKLTVRRDGFWPRKIVVDGSKPKVLVRLAPIPGKRPKVPVPAKSPDEVGMTSADEAVDEPAPRGDDEAVDEQPEPKGKGAAPKPAEPPKAPAEPAEPAPEE